MNRIHLVWCLALLVALATATTASAQRPSLVDLQAALDELQSPTPPAAVGTIRFVGGGIDAELPLVSLRLDVQVGVSCTMSFCSPNGALDFQLESVFVDTVQSTELFSAYIDETIFGTVSVATPSEPSLLVLQNARIESYDSEGVSARTRITLTFLELTHQVSGTTSGWNLQTSVGSGCSLETFTVVDLSGNSTSNILTSETEGTFAFEGDGFGTITPFPAMVATREPPSACALRATAEQLSYTAALRRLWENHDQFGGSRRFVQLVDFLSANTERWTVRVESGVLREDRRIFGTGGITLREFDDGDGSETANSFAPF